MPRALGQVDLRKSEAMLDAAAEVFAERGFGAPMDEIARRAGVSKQTIYNRYGSKEELLRALVERRRDRVTALLDLPGAEEQLEETLTRYVGTLLRLHLAKDTCNLMRLAITAAAEQPEIAAIVYEAGAKAGRARMAQFLARETMRGRLKVDNPLEAAEFLAGMAAGHVQLRTFLGVPQSMTEEEVDARARECARRFIRAYEA
jgi:AcrR family transcriptional regulator